MYFNNYDFKMYYEKHGTKGQTILILPGWGETRKTFEYMTKYLEKEFIVYIVDYPGFGNSPFPNRDLTIYDYTNLILDFLTSENIVDPIIIGHSFGGRIAITLDGYFHHKINKMILIGSAGIKPKKTLYQKIKQRLYKFLKKLQQFLPKKRRKKYLNYLIRKFGSTDFQQLNYNKRKTFIQIVNEDLTPYLSKIVSPTLLIWGELDDATPVEDGKKMEKEIADSALIVLKHCHHFCYLEEKELLNRIIDKFIKE